MNSDDLVKFLGIVLVAALLLYLVYSYNQKCKLRDSEAFAAAQSRGHQNVRPQDPTDNSYHETLVHAPFNVAGFENAPVPSAASASSSDALLSKSQDSQPADCYPRDRLTADDLLPQDANSKWAQVNPAGQGDIKDQNFLTAGYHQGINTVGSTLRNPNLQLRSDPVNPQLNVSPWNQTTVEPDLNRRALDIGGGGY
jgi:Ca2+/Na+ antiporter